MTTLNATTASPLALPPHVQAMSLQERELRKAWLKRKFGSFDYHEDMLRLHQGFVQVLRRALDRAEADGSPNAADSGYQTIADEAKHFRWRWFALIEANDDLGKYQRDGWPRDKYTATFRSIPDYSRYLMSEGDLLSWMTEAEHTELSKYWAPMARMAQNITYTVDERWEEDPDDKDWMLDEKYTGPIQWPVNWREDVSDLIGHALSSARCPAGQPCPQTGYWSTPATPNSRRHFTQGELMPDLGSAYGQTIWQWDAQQ